MAVIGSDSGEIPYVVGDAGVIVGKQTFRRGRGHSRISWKTRRNEQNWLRAGRQVELRLRGGRSLVNTSNSLNPSSNK